MAGLSRRAFLATGAALAACRPADPWLTEGAVAASGELATRLGLSGSPAIAERIGLERDLALVEQTGARFLVDQISTEGALDSCAPSYHARSITAVDGASGMYLVGSYSSWCMKPI